MFTEVVLSAVLIVAAPLLLRFHWRRFTRTPLGPIRRGLAIGMGSLLGLGFGIAFGQVNIVLGISAALITFAETVDMVAYNSDGGPENELIVFARNIRRVWAW